MVAGRGMTWAVWLIAAAAIAAPARAGDRATIGPPGPDPAARRPEPDPEPAPEPRARTARRADPDPPPRPRPPASSWRSSRTGAATEDDRGEPPMPRATAPIRSARREPRAVPAGPPPADGLDGASRRFRDAMERSRQIDREVEQIRHQLNQERVASVRNYDAQGFLQASSRQVDGQKVFVLIGREGKPAAYLDIPPGIATEPLLSRRIGVRGSIRLDEGLGTRLIRVRDIEPLDEAGPAGVVDPISVVGPSPTPTSGSGSDWHRRIGPGK